MEYSYEDYHSSYFIVNIWNKMVYQFKIDQVYNLFQ